MSNNYNLPPVPPRSNERQQQLELMIQEYKKQTQNLEAENMFYKKQCQQLENQLNRFKSTVFINGNESSKESIQTINDSYVDVTALTICEDIESYLEETNLKLKDENLIKPAFENLIEKLVLLVTFQYGSKDSQSLNRLKFQLISKLNEIEQKIQKYKSVETRCIEIERQYEKSNTELNAIKATLNCKQLVDSNEVDSLAIEFIKWKDEIKSINNKVNQQLNLVRTIVNKCEPIIDESKNRNNSVSPSTSTTSTKSNQDKNLNVASSNNNNNINNLFIRPNNRDENISPGNSPTQGFLKAFLNRNDSNSNQEFQSFQMIDNECNTIKTNNTINNSNGLVEDDDDDDNNRNTIMPVINNDNRGTNDDNHNNNGNNNINNADATLYRTYDNSNDDDNLWQCPICNTQVAKDTVKFEDYYEHASKCSGDQLTCMFCLKLFSKFKEDEYYKHIQQEHGE